MTLWNRARIFKIIVQLLLNPRRTELIFKGVEIASSDPEHAAIRAVESRALADDVFRAMHEENYLPDIPSMDALKSCPERSFGQALFKHMTDNGLSFNLWPRHESKRPIQYLSTRIYQDHDLWHTLLGYGVSVEDELAVQAFGVAQLQSPIALMLIAGGLIHLLAKDPRRALEAFRKVNEVYRLGSQAPFLPSFRLHEFFSRPLTEVRQVCGLS